MQTRLKNVFCHPLKEHENVSWRLVVVLKEVLLHVAPIRFYANFPIDFIYQVLVPSSL